MYVALAVNMEGNKELLGLWIGEAEGAKFWLNVLTELQSRGVEDILIACVDGLRGFPEAIESVFPRTEIQLCIVHLVRNSSFTGTPKSLLRARRNSCTRSKLGCHWR